MRVFRAEIVWVRQLQNAEQTLGVRFRLLQRKLNPLKASLFSVIVRQHDCQTCFMCEAWCPTDALFVAPQTAPVPADSVYRNEDTLKQALHDVQGLKQRYAHITVQDKGKRFNTDLLEAVELGFLLGPSPEVRPDTLTFVQGRPPWAG